MAVSPVLSSAVNGLLSAGNKVAKAAQDIVEAGASDLPQGGAGTTGATGGTFTDSTAGVDAQRAAQDPDLKLTSGLVALIEAETAYKANAAAIRAEDELGERLLDIET